MSSDRRDFNPRELINFFNILIFRDLIFWGTSNASNRFQIHGKGQAKVPDTGTDAGNTRGYFLINCFSFLFGDGNPNSHIEDEKWRLAAQTIRENGGVVIKEQLAPYIGPELEDADGILPVLARFDGRPAGDRLGAISLIFSLPCR